MRTKVVIFSIVFSLFFSTLIMADVAAKGFYEGRTIKILVGFKPGGGTDFYGRLMARYMMKYLPGSRIIVKNMPGAGSMIALNRIYASKPDGLTFGAFSRGLPAAQVVGITGVKFDMTRVSWLGSPSSEIYGLYVSPKTFKGLDDIIKAPKVRMAATGIGTLNYLSTLLFFQMMGLDNYSIGTGYSGNELGMVILRGEMDGSFGSFGTYQALLYSKDVRPILFIANSKPEGFENIPYIQDIITDKKHQPAIDFLVGLNVVGRPFVGPPGIPQNRLNILQGAFKKSVLDPEAKKLSDKANKPLEFVSPERCQKWVEGIFKLPPEVVKMLKASYGIKD